MVIKYWIFLMLGILGAFSFGYVEGVKATAQDFSQKINKLTDSPFKKNRETNMTNNESNRSSKGEN